MKIYITITAILFSLNCFSQITYWKAALNTGEYGLMQTNFILNKGDGFLKGSSTPNAHKRIIGGLKAAVAKSMFQVDGSIIELDSIVFKGDSLSGYLILEKRKYYLVGNRRGEKIEAKLTGKASGKVYGQLEATEVSAINKPKDYSNLWAEMRTLTENYIYNKSVLTTKEWKNFCDEMDEFAKLAEDDAEFAYGFFYKAKQLPFSHYALMGNKQNSTNFAIAGYNTTEDKIRPSLQKLNPKTLLLDVPAFNFRVKDIDSLMQQIVTSDAQNLIIDLRKNPGGDMEGGMRICQYLSPKTIYGGIMLSQAYWNKHSTTPALADYKNFKLMNTANYDWFKKEVKNGVEGLCIMTEPLANTFKGKVYILTSKTTASASEPFVYTLQKENIATVIGEKTAGAVISMEYFYLQNLAFTIPMLDYYTFDGNRLDKIGVEPNIKCESKDALNIAMSKLN